MTWMIVFIISVLWLPAIAVMLTTTMVESTLATGAASEEAAQSVVDRILTTYVGTIMILGLASITLRIYSTYSLNALKSLGLSRAAL